MTPPHTPPPTPHELGRYDHVRVGHKGEAHYWTVLDGRVLVAESLSTLISAIPKAELSLASLASFAERSGSIWLSPFEGVNRLTFGHQLRLVDGKPLVERWFHPERSPRPHADPSDTPERAGAVPPAGSRMAEAVSLAIRAELKGRQDVSVTMSGGLDSTMVAATAATIVEDRRRVHAYCAVPVRLPPSLPRGREADEWPWATAVADYSGITATRLVNDGRNDWLRQADDFHERHFQPVPAQANFWWLAAVEQAACASSRAPGLILSGQSGNATFSVGPPGTPPVLRPDGTWKRRFTPRHPRALAKQMRAATQRADSPIYRPVIPATMPPHVLEMDQWTRWCLAEPPLPRHRRWTDADVRWADPLGSPGVIETAMRLPPTVWGRTGTDRALARNAAMGLLPDSVRLNRTRGLQGSDLPWLLLENADRYERAIGEVCDSPTARGFLHSEALWASRTMLRRDYDSAFTWQERYLNPLAVGLFAAWWDRRKL